MKILHISFHQGCQNDIEYVCKKLGIDLTFMKYEDENIKGGDIYNITHERALNNWTKNKDYYNTFDLIITSDTAPISRVFLQNNFQKKLIIWICNRFDYAHQPDAEKIGFPDKEYYDLINDVKNRPNISIIGYTPFENIYANHIKKLNIGNECIKPIGQIGDVYNTYTSTIIEDKKNTFIIGPYHNDNLMIDLKSKVKSLGIKVFNGRYNGPKDLAEFAGVIHIPYAWSNLALFEAIQLGIIYFIPSKIFLLSFKNMNFWHQNMSFLEKYISKSEWYLEEHKNILIYFDSWNDLNIKINNLDFEKHKIILKTFGEKHNIEMLQKWKNIIKI
jgi:hypothetical protein